MVFQIAVAVAAYDRLPIYERYAPDQLRDFAAVWDALRIVEDKGTRA
jgi:hypothetical protein